MIVAIENYLFVPRIAGATAAGSDWYRFFSDDRGIPVERVALLADKEAVREKIVAAATRASAAVEPGGTLWFVFVGHGAPVKIGDRTEGVLIGADTQQDAESLQARGVLQSELGKILANAKADHVVALLDACFSGQTASGPVVPGLQPLLVVRQAPSVRVTWLSAASSGQLAGPLPGAARPAFSYLALGALRGWGDADGDGTVTAKETVDYARKALTTLQPQTGRSQTPELAGQEPDVALVHGAKESGPRLAALIAAAARAPEPTTSAEEATRCEIVMPPGGCPRTGNTVSFDDNWEHADRDPERCMKRGAEWFSHCGGAEPIIARFHRGATVAREASAGGAARCQITVQACPRDANVVGVFNDDAEHAGSDEARCLRRAHDFYDHCGGSSGVTARFYPAAGPPREERFEPQTHCQITVQSCPRNPGVAAVFNDEGDGADHVEPRCATRAADWWNWCGSGDPVTARYFEGAKMVRETRFESPTHCQVTIALCPRKSEIAGTFNDDAEHSGSDDARCVRRAWDWYSWCGGSQPVTARFYKGATVLREQRTAPPTRCQISVPDCPNNGGVAGMFNDDAEHCDSDEARCMRRAADWKSYCAATGPVTARFFRGDELKRETTAP